MNIFKALWEFFFPKDWSGSYTKGQLMAQKFLKERNEEVLKGIDKTKKRRMK